MARELLEEARLWLRISGSDFDPELGQTIQACLLDLAGGGVAETDPQDPLIRQAIKLYLKSHFGYEEERESWAKAYERLKGSLGCNGDYREETETPCES